MRIKQIWHYPWIVAVCNFLLIMCVYSLSRLFFYWTNSDLFPDVSGTHLFEMCVGGLRFDLTALLYINAIYLLMQFLPFRFRQNEHYQTAARWVFWVTNIIGIVINCADMVYVRFTDRRTTLTIFSEFQNDNNIADIIFKSVLQYWYVTLFALAVIALVKFCTRRSVQTRAFEHKPIRYYLHETLVFCVSVYFVIIGIRGGFGAYTRPITISNAMQYVDKPAETAIVLNTPFSLMKSLENTAYVNPHYLPDDELNSVFSPEHRVVNYSTLIPTHKNVVILILESFSKEYIGYFNADLDGGTYRGYTPFLDSLLQHSVTYDLSFASGRKSIDAMPSILSSIPMLIEPYIVTPYSTNDISSIADCLKQKGYTSAFFHGAPNGSMGFQAFAKSANFDSYYGMSEYDGPEAFDGTWAIWDEEFLQYYALKMSELHEPFVTSVFTASSHHPFRVPQRYEGVFQKGTEEIHQCVGYSDNALRLFFNQARQQKWYKNTLFVLVADHTNQLTHDVYHTSKGIFEVPIAFYDPEWSSVPENQNRQVPVSQTDIMPSVLAYLGYDTDFFAFGEDVLTKSKTHPYVVNYNNPVYQVISNHLLVQFDGNQVVAIYDFVQDPLCAHNLKVELEQTDEVAAMVTYLKAYIQQYIARMVENRLVIQK